MNKVTKLTLTRVFRTKEKDGKPLVSKQGKPYEKVAVKAKEFGEAWISGFGNKGNSGWKEGDVVEIELSQNGDYLNFKMPSLMVTKQEFEDLSLRVTHIWKHVFKDSLPVDEDSSAPVDQDIPF